MRLAFCSSVIALAVVVAVGCSKVNDKWSAARPKVSPGGGIVNYKGKPVEGATLVFSPENGTHAATGVTDANGRFKLSTFNPGDGAVAGKYQVTVTKVEMPPQTAAPASHDEPTPAKAPPKFLVPEKYSKPEASDLTAEVTDGGKNEYTFELKD